ncbi:MAG: DNA polymerase III subunit delta [Verrucomicrobiae bacterium]|nr:DNA polymerase III subunit delta [Verrucomicrobiae bacterium]
MPAKSPKSLYLVCGSEEYLVKENARRLAKSLAPKGGAEFAVEIVDGAANNADEAGKAVFRVLEAINTLGFFSAEKLIWMKDVSFLGTEKLWQSDALAEALAPLTDALKAGLPAGVTLLVSTGEVDKRRAFYKACEKNGEVLEFNRIDTTKDRGWQDKVSDFIAARARALGKTVSDDGVTQLMELNGANFRQIEIELEKIAAYVGERGAIEADDVRAVGCASREAIAWDLPDAMGERNLGRALGILDRLLFQGEEVVGLLFALAARVRQLLILRELMDRRALRPGDYGSVQSQLNRLPASIANELPGDKKLNPLLQHPFVVFKTLAQAANYSRPQLILAMQRLLDANQLIVTGAVPDRIALEKALAQIITTS